MKKVNVSKFYEKGKTTTTTGTIINKRKKNGCVECGALRHSKYSNCSKKNKERSECFIVNKKMQTNLF